ncbi:MAG: hypothetical protein WCF90_06205 [Methanomicrobiales archaeon]
MITRWDLLTEEDNPEGVIFFTRPKVMSGISTLANFDHGDPNGVICPMGGRVQFDHLFSMAGAVEG